MDGIGPWNEAPIRMGLVGAGPWATLVHAAMIAAGPETTLCAVWSRRFEAAEQLASKHGAIATETFDALLAHCDAVAFAVPPDVQATLATTAARAGKALLLEKPIALELAAAEKLADEVAKVGVSSMVLLTWRYDDRTIEFLERVTGQAWIGGEGRFVHDGALGGMFATPWRLERGPLFDLGPHVIDLLAAALGPVREIRAAGDTASWVSLLLEHDTGRVSTAALSASVPGKGTAGVRVYGDEGVAELDCDGMAQPDTFARVRRTFAEAVVAGQPAPLDVGHGLELARLIASAAEQLE